MVTELLRNSSILGLLGLLVSLAAVGMALAYAIKPNERRLALIRPLSLAAIFGGLSTFTAGLASVLQGIAATASFTVDTWRPLPRAPPKPSSACSSRSAASRSRGFWSRLGCGEPLESLEPRGLRGVTG